ncbi:hypothetical protein RhiirC2_864398 [Rhizophagus irregularis]|uniref:BACK domain-containing protein n=1 Tax=Rhizophagus irregularis TaxID=588596 RepID=A0A2N1NI36_9GLOM|nr:hypothetical protein RhiirC2_864398 [Rhizophagus irregularis]
MNGPDILKLLVATEELGLDRVLSEYIQEFLIEDQNKFSQDDCIELLKIVFQHGTFTILEDYCLKTICQVPAILFGTDKILSLPAQILELLLKRDDLALDEIELWNNLVRWAHAQQPTVNKDPSKWTKDELILMEKMLLNFIPLIRWMPIFGKDLAMQLNGYKWTSSPYAYPNLNIPNNFEIDDYEVFQILLILLEISTNERSKNFRSFTGILEISNSVCSENDECITILMSNNYLYFGGI